MVDKKKTSKTHMLSDVFKGLSDSQIALHCKTASEQSCSHKNQTGKCQSALYFDASELQHLAVGAKNIITNLQL